jgi:hypothetical protein
MAHGVRDLGPALRLKVGEEFESAGVLGTVVQPAQRHHAVGVIAAAVRARGEVRGRDVLRLPPHDAGAADESWYARRRARADALASAEAGTCRALAA